MNSGNWSEIRGGKRLHSGCWKPSLLKPTMADHSPAADPCQLLNVRSAVGLTVQDYIINSLMNTHTHIHTHWAGEASVIFRQQADVCICSSLEASIVLQWPSSTGTIFMIWGYEAWNTWEGSHLSQNLYVCVGQVQIRLWLKPAANKAGVLRGIEKKVLKLRLQVEIKAECFGGKVHISQTQARKPKQKLPTFLYVMNMDGNKSKLPSKHLPKQPSGWFLLRFIIVAPRLLFRRLKQ